MQYARKKTRIKCRESFHSIEEFAEYLKKQKESPFVHKKEGKPEQKLDFAVVEDENGKSHIILVALALLNILRLGKINHLDATYGSRPKLVRCTQLLTLMIRVYNKVS